jgi:hypothetical protein
VSSLPLEIQPRDLEIMRSLFESRIMTAAHISILHFDSRAEATKKRLQKLKSAGFIKEQRLGMSDAAILSLGSQGIRLLESNGILQEYPQRSLPALLKRTRVAPLTIQHELDVLDVKAVFHLAAKSRPNVSIQEFCTWPACFEFQTVLDGREIPIQPDGYISIHERESDGSVFEHSFFLEVDRSHEVQNWLVNHAKAYQEHYRSGEFAESSGGRRDKPDEYPFRVLMIFKTAERRNNLAERLLQSYPPILSRVWLSTFSEVKANPFGEIWIRPRDYRDATKGTRFDPELERKSWTYRRQTERELLVESKVKKLDLFKTR